MSKRVVIIGGGYGGLRAVESLANRTDINIVLIDKNPYHYLQTEAYGYIAGKFDLHDVVIDLQTWCSGFKNGVEFINQSACSVDFQTREVQLQTQILPYDYLILATGTKTNFFPFISGLRENSYGVKNIKRAHNFRIEFQNLIYNKLQNDKYENHQEINLAIGGAGLSGVEVAAEMAYIIHEYSKTIGERAKEIKIHLIDASETILPGMSSYLISNTKKRLEKLGVNILTNTYINSLDKEFIHFKDGMKLKYHFMIFTGGIKASTLNETISCEKNGVNQLIADENLNVAGHKNVFAIGDCVEIRDRCKNIMPPTAQIAEKSAEYVAKSIANRIDLKPIEPFEPKVLGVFVALGGKYATGELFKVIKVKGYWAYLLKKAITYSYYLGLNLRINAGYKNRSRTDQQD